MSGLHWESSLPFYQVFRNFRKGLKCSLWKGGTEGNWHHFTNSYKNWNKWKGKHTAVSGILFHCKLFLLELPFFFLLNSELSCPAFLQSFRQSPFFHWYLNHSELMRTKNKANKWSFHVHQSPMTDVIITFVMSVRKEITRPNKLLHLVVRKCSQCSSL